MKDETLTEDVKIERGAGDCGPIEFRACARCGESLGGIWSQVRGKKPPNRFMTGQVLPLPLRSSLRLLAISFVRAISFI